MTPCLWNSNRKYPSCLQISSSKNPLALGISKSHLCYDMDIFWNFPLDTHIWCTETSIFNSRLNSICLEKELILKYFPSRSVPFDLPRKCQFIFQGRFPFSETLLTLGSSKDDFNSNKPPLPRRFRKSGFCCISYQYALLVDCFG